MDSGRRASEVKSSDDWAADVRETTAQECQSGTGKGHGSGVPGCRVRSCDAREVDIVVMSQIRLCTGTMCPGAEE